MKSLNVLLMLLFVFAFFSANCQETSTLTDPRDGKVYRTAKIGSKWWMMENLNYQSESDCWCYKNDSANCAKYGRLYTWKMSKKVCPEGWHLSNIKDWFDLEKAAGLPAKQFDILDFRGIHAVYLKSIGFVGNYGGLRDAEGKFMDKDIMLNFWTKDEYSAAGAMYEMINLADSSVLRSHTYKKIAFSVRCVKDEKK